MSELRKLTGGTNSPIGDDCAILEEVAPPLLATVDCMVSDVHFSSDATDEQLARKLVGMNISDIAAMGGEPWWALLSSARSQLTQENLFEEALLRELREVDAELVGGDLSATVSGGDSFLSLTLLGSPSGDHVLRRDAANPGDKIVVSGSLGAVKALLSTDQPLDESSRDRLYDPPKRLELGQTAVDSGVRAAIDLSDGLVKDLGRLIEASGVGARLDPGAIPIDPVAQSRADNETQALRWALDGGEDFELLLTVPSGVLVSLESTVPLSVVGTVTDREGIRWDPSLPDEVNTGSLGYDHFS